MPSLSTIQPGRLFGFGALLVDRFCSCVSGVAVTKILTAVPCPIRVLLENLSDVLLCSVFLAPSLLLSKFELN